MAKKPRNYTKSDNRSFNLSLIASLFTVFLITMVDIIVDLLNAYDLGITPFLGKVAIAGLVFVVFWHQMNHYHSKQRIR